MRIITSDNVELNVRISGEGKPCLFLHGGPGAWSYNFEVFGGKVLEKYFQMIYLDQRGCGRSGKVKNKNFSIDRIIQDIDEVREALNIQKWTVIAHSFGGILAVNYVRKYEGNIESLILLNATLNMKESFEYQIKYGVKLLKLQSNEEYLNEKTPLIDRWYKVVNKLIEKDLFYKLQYENYSSFIEVNKVDEKLSNDGKFAQYVFNSYEYFKDFTEYTDDIIIPVLIISGKEDYAIGPNHYKKFKFKNSKQCLLEGKHVLYYENTKGFEECISNFLKKSKLG